MLGLRIFICSLFVWLSFASPQEFSGEPSTIESQTQLTVSSSGFDHHALIVDTHFELNRVNWSLKTFKIASHFLNDTSDNLNADTYQHKLLYIEIGNTIPLKLTPSTIIFPFHTFT